MLVHQILTTENVPFSYRVAGVGSRMWAWMVDVVILVVILFIPFCFLLPLATLAPFLRAARAGFGWKLGLLLVFLYLFPIVYFILTEWLWSGQTIGKRMGIRTISIEGTRLTLIQSVVRNLVRLVDCLPLAKLPGLIGFAVMGLYGAGVAVSAANAKGRRFGDLAAGTLVVFVDRQIAPVRFFLDASREVIPERELLWRQRLGTLNKEQKETIMDLCLRRDQLRLKDRTRLFQAVSAYLQERLQIPREENQSDERYVQQVAALLMRGY
jgi:uncharacterized RDD family membrane protein YckC